MNTTNTTYNEGFNRPTRPIETSRDVLRMMAKIYGVKEADIVGRSRKRSIIPVRNEFFYRAEKIKGMSVRKLAGLYGFHPSTLLMSIGKHVYTNNLPSKSALDYAKEIEIRRVRAKMNYHKRKARKCEGSLST